MGELLQEGYDIDFFAIDSTGNLAHFASGGNRVPEAISSTHEIVKVFFEQLPIICKVEINSEVISIKDFVSKEIKDLYLDSFVLMAGRGLYSFDNRMPGASLSFQYQLVAWPRVKKLNSIDIPPDIRKMLIELPVNFKNISSFDFQRMYL